MPVITDGSREQHVTEAEAARLVGDGIVHVLNPFDQATLGLCPGYGWADVLATAAPGQMGSPEPAGVSQPA